MSRTLPILFNTEMVRAILDGRKTVTRRLVKLPKYIQEQENGLYTLFTEGTCYEDQNFEQITDYLKKPYQPGDILYVRETWFKDVERYMYRADYSSEEKFYKNGKEIVMKWRPSIHMPKEAARIWLKVTDVRVERLQDITPEDAWKEGAICNCMSPVPDCAGNKTGFIKIWNSTLKKSDLAHYGWDASPWVWVIEFELCVKPEGAL